MDDLRKYYLIPDLGDEKLISCGVRLINSEELSNPRLRGRKQYHCTDNIDSVSRRTI